MVVFTTNAIFVYFKEEENHILEKHFKKAAGKKKTIKPYILEGEIKIWILLETVFPYPVLSNP